MSATIDAPPAAPPRPPAFIATGHEWTFDDLTAFDRALAAHARRYGLDTYPNRIEVISSEQMLEAYASTGMPVNYAHWSFGKNLLANQEAYRRGRQGLAYEIVINSDPCITYLMEENTLALQALVIAHASYGHNSFFKGNYLFRQWTTADSIVDYLLFARRYIAQCEELHGIEAVERTLDACHALRNYGVDRYQRPARLNSRRERDAQAQRLALARETNRRHELASLLPEQAGPVSPEDAPFPAQPHENLLYFMEKFSPTLEPWQRELARIVRKIAQYFYPQRQTKVCNEGWATFWHYTLLNDLYDHRQVDDAFMLEWLGSHTNVIYQPPYSSPQFSGFNPYALGFAIFRDMRRMCEQPTDEDRHWHPEVCGKPWVEQLQLAMANYRDESFILQFLSPRVMRQLGMFGVSTAPDRDHWQVDGVAADEDYQRLRSALARTYRAESHLPDIQVSRVDRRNTRQLTLQHLVHRERELDADSVKRFLAHARSLWGFPVVLEDIDGGSVSRRWNG